MITEKDIFSDLIDFIQKAKDKFEKGRKEHGDPLEEIRTEEEIEAEIIDLLVYWTIYKRQKLSTQDTCNKCKRIV